MDAQIDKFIDWIYKSSSLNNFVKMVEASAPVFKYSTLVETQEISLQNYREDMIIPYNQGQAEPSLDIASKKFLLNLEDKFKEFVENHCITERISFYKNNIYKPPIKYLKVNTRFHLTSKKLDVNRYENILGIIEQCQIEIYNYYQDDLFYAIVSPEIANFIGHNTVYPVAFSTFNVDTTNVDPVFIHPFGKFKNMTIFVDPRMNQNTMIFGTTKRFDHGNTLFYYKSEHPFFEYADSGYSLQKKMCLNLYHTIKSIDYEPKFKKIILDV